MVPSLTMQEQEWLRAQHPKLFYFPSYGRIVGDFEFKASYNNVAVKDSYQVRIELNETSFFMPIPKVYVMDNRIERASKILKREMIDMHVFPDGSLCLTRQDSGLLSNESGDFAEFYLSFNGLLLLAVFFGNLWKRAMER